jgi:hypothetical protein
MIGGGGGGPGKHAQSRRWLPSAQAVEPHVAVAVEYEQIRLSRHMYGVPHDSAFEASCSATELHAWPAATNASSTSRGSVSVARVALSHVLPTLPQMVSHDP